MTDMEVHPKMYMYRRIVEAKTFIDKHYADKINLNEISNQAAFSKYHFLRLFKEAFGTSPHKYLTAVRLKHARRLLEKGSDISEVCYAVGFESVPSFTALFKSNTGVSPKAYMTKVEVLRKKQEIQPRAYVPGCFAQSIGLDK